MKILNDTQGDDSWWTAKTGVPSASNFHRIYACATGRLSDGIDDYIRELIADRQCMLPKYFTSANKPTTPAMQRGVDLEPVARKWYAERVAPLNVYQVGFCVTDCGRFGASPDFMAGDDGCGEIKIYDDAKHAKWVREGVLPSTFAAQVHGQLLITGRPWSDLVLWSETQECKVIRTEPNETTAKLRVALEIFHERLQKALTRAGLCEGRS